MRVGIYNRWLSTLGGGEKHSLAIAEYLSVDNDVDVISHTSVSKKIASSRLNVDMSRVNFVVIPELPAKDLGPLTAGYDLFINASHLDFVPSRAAHSVLIVYFPLPITTQTTFRSIVGRQIKRQLMVPTFIEGAYGITNGGGRQYRPTTSKLKVELPISNHSYHVSFDIAAQDISVEKINIYLDNQMVDQISLAANHEFKSCRVLVPVSNDKKYHELQLCVASSGQQKDNSLYKMAVSNMGIDHPRYRIYQLLFEDWFKEWGLRLNGVPASSSASPLDAIDTYHDIWAISDFTRHWIHSYWRRDSHILNPPIDVDQFVPGEKSPWILSVGRFFEGSHNKKHLIMIRAFKEMLNDKLHGWELHLAGGTSPSAIQQEYLEQVKTEAKGYPIVIHTDVSFSELVQLYARSSIYWHASGYGEDEGREPIKFEHFGITTVEAMSAGCVPVVIAKGGQPEIVHHAHNGFLWGNIKELKEFTQLLVTNITLRSQLANVAIYDSYKYDKRHFQTNVGEALRRIWMK
jgi:glycosyltransferase involved in cell wall biosynthesis